MQNCYVPRAVPVDDGKSKQGGGELKVPNGENRAPRRIQDVARATRGDGRKPYDMRQVRIHF